LREEKRVARPLWQWDESVQRGTDYAGQAEVQAYDERMAALRDVSAEAEKILSLLSVTPDDVVMEIGTGTGAFAREAAKRCRLVIALDVSEAMLVYARERAAEEGVANIRLLKAGFLTYEHEGQPVAAAVSQLALHHLPDAWKVVALRRLAGFIRPGGRLFLTDVVFPDDAIGDPLAYFQTVVDSIPASSRQEMARHVRQEFSTFDCLMREIIVRAGFAIENVDMDGGYLYHYLCRRSD
jgi:putative AdoMet-dependent methyltransferase